MTSALRQFIFFVVLLAMPVSSFFLVFQPQNNEIEKAKKEITLKESKLEKLREVTRRADDLQRQNDQIREAIQTIQSRLPTTKEMDNVLRQVSGLAAKANLVVPQFKKSDKTAQAGLAMEQPLDIEMTGDFDGFYQFLLDLEKLPRITRIPDLSIVRSDDANGAMKTKFTLSVYYEGETSENTK